RSGMSVAASGWRLAIDNPLLRAVPLPELADNECNVMYRSGGRSLATGFAATARQVVMENIHLVDGARLVA
ncbi:MAG: hypothetical protein QM662_02730, partial [Gordonia sp. (in: high G+C Gram-positive bacteria)]